MRGDVWCAFWIRIERFDLIRMRVLGLVWLGLAWLGSKDRLIVGDTVGNAVVGLYVKKHGV